MISISQGLRADNGVRSGLEFPEGSWDGLNWVDYKEEKPKQTLTLCLSPETAPASCCTPTLAWAECGGAAAVGL